MQAYHNEPALKVSVVAQMRGHIARDELIHGKYWENGKGCAVGCVAHDSEYPHQTMSEFIGVPVQLAQLLDGLFEALPNGEAKALPMRFLEAIRPGADLSRIWPQFAHWLLADPEVGILALPDLVADVRAPTEIIARLKGAEGRRELSAEERAEGDKAAWAAGAARAARAAWAARDARAAGAARAARDAWAARAARAAWDAWDAWAAGAAGAALAKKQADKLIELLAAA